MKISKEEKTTLSVKFKGTIYEVDMDDVRWRNIVVGKEIKKEYVLHLINKLYVSQEELEEILESDYIFGWKNYGLLAGYEWYVVYAIDGMEYKLYV